MNDFNRIAFLIGAIYFYGDFKAETCNERELESLLRKHGYFFESEDELLKRAAQFSEQPANRSVAGGQSSTNNARDGICPFHKIDHDFNDESAQEFGVHVCTSEGKLPPVA